MDISRRQFAIGSAALAGASALPFGMGSALAQAPLKVGFVYVGPVSDHGFSYQHDLGRKEVEKAYGAKVQTTFVENVPEGADAERVINQLAAQGNGLIFTTSFGFMNPTIRVAQRHPKVKFEHCTGYKRADNVATYSARFYEGRTICGALAGKLTKSNIIGYIGSFPIPEVVSGINAFTVALRRVNPQAQVRVVWVNSWYDPGKEADAAKALLDQGADVITQHTDSPAPCQIAEQRGAWSFGQSSDMQRFAPNKLVTSIVDDWGPYYVRRVKEVMDGTWKAIDTWDGIKQGLVVIPPFNPSIGADNVALGQKVKDDIVAGRLHPFAGPIKDQQGKVVYAEGKHASDEDILKMAFYVEGVQGSLPK
ncbi:BMP family ABC transporter substrate-binding protein [Arenibaculum pallidiluteum]|uniref:BMP family ABC transporter substrate-binding protein n=1 Tax=Arenibaculum pallidiluteum TaxID=2812559 RepID=UPI001A9718DF|nr:BMP family ABC transporter substrate-binding protein [Arenibaculum pallidiluteum]